MKYQIKLDDEVTCETSDVGTAAIAYNQAVKRGLEGEGNHVILFIDREENKYLKLTKEEGPINDTGETEKKQPTE